MNSSLAFTRRLRHWYAVFSLALVIALLSPYAAARAQRTPALPLSGVEVNVAGPMGLQVNSFNGNLYYSRSELAIPGRGPSLAIDLAYNSAQSDLDGSFGFGWQFSYDIFYEKVGNDVLIARGDGRVDHYVSDRSQFLRPPGVRDALEAVDANSYVLTSPDGVKTFFESPDHRRVTRIQDANGNALTFSYSGTQLTRIVDAAGRQLTLSHENNRVTAISDPNASPSRTVRFQYDDAGNLTGLTDSLGNTTAFKYTFVAPYHLLSGMTDPRGSAATITYSGRAVANITTAVTNMAFAYDPATKTTAVTEVVDGGNQVSRYVYDANNRISSIQDGLGHATTMTWDDRNRLISATDQNGQTASYTYDDRDNVLSVTDPLGNVTRYTYDNPFNKVTSVTDANGGTTRYQYDSRGNLITLTNALNQSTSFTYDERGNLITTTDANARATTFSYDAHGDQTAAVNPLGQTISFSYDNVGNVQVVTDANGQATTMQYDARNRLTSTTNALGQMTSFAYDANDNLTQRTDPLGNAFAYAYDALDRLTQVTDALKQQTTYTYDQKDNLRTIVDAKGQVTTFIYDAANRLTSETDPLGNTTRYSYDNASNQTGKIDANGNQISYAYDALNRLTTATYPPGGGDTPVRQIYLPMIVRGMSTKAQSVSVNSNPASNQGASPTRTSNAIVSYSYDKVGNLTGMSNADVSVTYRYDAADQLTEAVTTVPGLPAKSVHYTYDNAGNRATMTDPDGGVTSYNYDDADQLIRLVNPAGQATSYTYDNAGRLTRKDAPNGMAALYTYDAADQLSSLTNQTSSGTPLSRFSYQYDNAGNRTRMTDVAGQQTSYIYDARYQLTGVNYPDGTAVGYTYDAVGNRAQEKRGSATLDYAYDAANRLLNAGTTTYKWDNNGNQIGKNAAGSTGSTSYAYDSENRLTNVTFAQGGVNHFTYYPDGRRLSARNAAGQTTYFFYDGLNVLTEANSGGATTARYTSAGVDDWLSMDRNGATDFYQQDGLGSIVSLTDASQRLAATYQYDAFGMITKQTGSLVNPYRFAGREYDADSGLYYNRARYYNAEAGRFTSQDPVRGSMRLPATLQRYSYVTNNPVNFVDPLGNFVHKSKVGKWVTKKATQAGKWVANSSVGGAITGAIAGAFIGCAAGIAGGPLGCLIGGAAGGIAGGIIGYNNPKVGLSALLGVGVGCLLGSKKGAVAGSFTGGPAGVAAGGLLGCLAGGAAGGLVAGAAAYESGKVSVGYGEGDFSLTNVPAAPRRAGVLVTAQDIGNTGGGYADGGGGAGPGAPHSAAQQAVQVVINAPSGSNESTTSTNFVDMPDMAGTVALHDVSDLAITLCAETSVPDGRMFARALVDDVPASPDDVLFAEGDTPDTHCFTFVRNGVAAGNHSVRVQWLVDPEGSASVGDRALQITSAQANSAEVRLLAVAAPSGPDVALTGGWVDIPDMSGSINLPAASDLAISFSAEAATTNNARLFLRAVVDGVVADPADAVLVVGARVGTRTFSFIKSNVSAGVHEVRLQALVDGGGEGFLGDRTLKVVGAPQANAQAAGHLMVAVGSSSPQEASFEWSDVPDMRGSLRVPAAGNVAVSFSAEIMADGEVDNPFIRILLDGQPTNPEEVVLAEGMNGTYAFTFVQRNVSAGDHLIQAQWKRASETTVTVGKRTLTAVAFAQ